MKKSSLIYFKALTFLLLLFSSGPVAGTNSIEGWDGPYIINLPNGDMRFISVAPGNVISDTIFSQLPSDFTFPVVSHSGDYSFGVTLRTSQRPQWKYKKPKEVFVTSDPHGRLDCFANLLQENGVIDGQMSWCYGKNHLVIIGDVFDRGDDVTAILWLLYKLEHEAAMQGGRVSYHIGNHEPMVLNNDMRYATSKYLALADSLALNYSELFAENTVLGQWLSHRNTIQQIGENLYVHAGLSREFLEKEISIELANQDISRGLFMNKKQRKEDSELMEFLYGSSGPLWYRGMVRTDEKYNPLDEADIKAILKRFKAKRVIVGHTIFPDITSFFDGKVIDVNVNNMKNKEEDRGRALLIKGDKIYVVGNKGVVKSL